MNARKAQPKRRRSRAADQRLRRSAVRAADHLVRLYEERIAADPVARATALEQALRDARAALDHVDFLLGPARPRH